MARRIGSRRAGPSAISAQEGATKKFLAGGINETDSWRERRAVARANTAIRIELIKRLKANGVVNEEEATALFEDAAQFPNYKGTKGVANVQEAARMVREMVELV